MPRSSIPNLKSSKPAKAGPSEDREGGVQVLERAAEILRLLRRTPLGLTQAEMAVQLNLARTTVHRIVTALVKERLVELRGATTRYRIGSEILRMAVSARTALVSDIHPRLQALSYELQETVDLATLDRGQITFIDQVVSPQRLRAVSTVGVSFPAHCTAPGKAMLASMQTAEINRLLPETLEASTQNTITSLAKLHLELENVRKLGYAIDNEEHTLGISAVGVLLPDASLGLASISVPIPAQRFAEKRAAAIAALLKTAKQLESEWGG